MQMTYEQAMRPGTLMLFARGGSGYMMRSEKRGGAYGSPNRRPPRRKKAGFFYIFFTLLLSVLLWPIGMVMLWQRKVRMTSGTKLLISLLTLCMSVFLIVFALTVPLDNVEFTAFQDKANDWLDKAAADVAVAGDAAMKKTSETWKVMTDFAEAGKKQLKSVLPGLLPASFAELFPSLCGISAVLPCNQITAPQREKLIDALKHLPLTVKAPRSLDEAIVTRGGVSVKEIEPGTLRSKLIPNLFFAGEMIDVDAHTGGFNLQIAWSTGALAGQSAVTE